MSDSLFTQIIKGEISSHKVYEDSLTYAFLDIHPVQPGHTLVIPKAEVQFVWDLSQSDYRALMEAVKLIAQRLKEVLDKPYIGSEIVGIDVPHAHVHLIPFSSTAEFRRIPDKSAEPNHAELADMAKRLAF